MAIAGLFRSDSQGVIVREIQRPKKETVEKFSEVYSAFVLDHMGKYGAMSPSIKPLSTGMKICGPAVTSLGPDLSVRRMAINLAQSGDVLVVAAGGDPDTACFGDGTSTKMRLKGMNGAVIDGATRDAGGIIEMEYPVFVKGVTPRNFQYPESPLHGSVNVPVVCGGVLVHPGDLILGDDDGVVVVPRKVADSIVDDVLKNLELERSERTAMKEFQEFDVEQELIDRGYKFV